LDRSSFLKEEKRKAEAAKKASVKQRRKGMQSMAVTMKQIAEVCHVSRGTVDRVLNNRGKVKPDIDRKVREMAKQMGYRPNTAGKALAARKKNYMIGVLLVSEGNEFFLQVEEGIRQATEEIADYGIRVLVRSMKGYDVERQLTLMNEMKEEVQFLILHAINDERIWQGIHELTEAGIAVATLNSDIEESGRLFYVGGNFIKSGETAAGMMALMMNGQAQVLIASGSIKSLGHNQRVYGFGSLCKKKYPGLQIKDIIETDDDDERAYRETSKVLNQQKEISAIYIVAAGAAGVCKAVSDSGRMEQISVIASDDTKATREWMERGLIKAIICQRPWMQGYQAILAATEYLVKDKEPQQEYIMPNDILIAENLP